MSYLGQSVSQPHTSKNKEAVDDADSGIRYIAVADIGRRVDDPRFLSATQSGRAAALIREEGPPVLTVYKTPQAGKDERTYTAISGAPALEAIRDAGLTHVPARLIEYTETDVLKAFVSEQVNVKMSTLDRGLAAQALVQAQGDHEDNLAFVSRECGVGRDQLRNLLTIAQVADGNGREVAAKFPTSAAPALRRIKAEGPWTTKDLQEARVASKRSAARAAVTKVLSRDAEAVFEVLDEAAGLAEDPELREKILCMRAAFECAQSGLGARAVEQSLADLMRRHETDAAGPDYNRAGNGDGCKHSQPNHTANEPVTTVTLDVAVSDQGDVSEHQASRAASVSGTHRPSERRENRVLSGDSRSGASGPTRAADTDAADETHAHRGGAGRRSLTQRQRAKGQTFAGPVIDRVEFVEYASKGECESLDERWMEKQEKALARVNELARKLGLCSEGKQYLRRGRLYAHANEHSKRPEKLGGRELALMLAVCQSAQPILSTGCSDAVLAEVIREMQELGLEMPADVPDRVMAHADGRSEGRT